MKTTGLLAALISLALCVTHGHADEQSHRQAVEELLTAMRMDVTLTKSIEMQMTAGGGSPEMVEATKEFYSKYLTWDSVKPELLATYMEKFTEAEIRDLAKFYRTSVGQKLLEAQPALSAAVTKILMDRTREHMDEYQRMMAEAMGREPPPQQQQHAVVEVPVKELSPLDATFVVSFEESDVPEGARPGDIKTAVIGNVIQRLKALGITGVDLFSVDTNSASLRIAMMSAFSREEVAELLERSGELMFRFVSPDNARLVADSRRDPGRFQLPEGYERCEMPVKRGEEIINEVLFVESKAEELSDQDVDQAVVTGNEFGHWSISLTFTAKGAQSFRKITADNVGKRLAIIVDGKVLSAPVIREAISGGKAQITGSLGPKEAELLAAAIDSGRYPVPVKVTAGR